MTHFISPKTPKSPSIKRRIEDDTIPDLKPLNLGWDKPEFLSSPGKKIQKSYTWEQKLRVLDDLYINPACLNA